MKKSNPYRVIEVLIGIVISICVFGAFGWLLHITGNLWPLVRTVLFAASGLVAMVLIYCAFVWWADKRREWDRKHGVQQ